MARAARTRTLEVTIGELSPGGDGVAICELEGERRAVFVPGVAPGERVRVEAELSSRPARGRLLEILAPSAERVAPPCEHLARCGACDWMHLAPPAQQREHASIVARALPRAFPDTPVTSHAAPRALGYRTRTRVHVDARRKLVVGMFGRGTHEAVEVDRCVVLDPVVERARGALAGWLEGARGRGEALLSVGAPPERRPVLDLRWKGELPPAVFGRLERAVLAGELGGARVFAGEVRIPATIGDPAPWIVGADDEPLRLAPGGFAQASEEANAALARRVRDVAAELAPDRDAPVLELYAGAGNLTVLLARDHTVTAVEADRDACAAARDNLAARGLRARVVDADAATFAVPKGTKLVVLDPPRTGARELARALAARPVPAVVYVSCDPPTLGRDLTALAEAGYALGSVDTFEMFPQTSHVETVAVLTHGRARASR